MEVAGQPEAKAMIVDWQREPLKDELIHIDMKRIASPIATAEDAQAQQ